MGTDSGVYAIYIDDKRRFTYKSLLSFFDVNAIIFCEKLIIMLPLCSIIREKLPIMCGLKGEFMHYTYQEISTFLADKTDAAQASAEVQKDGKTGCPEKEAAQVGSWKQCKQHIKAEAKKEVLVELSGLQEGLDILEKWEDKNMHYEDERARFSRFFQDAILGAFYRYRCSKRTAWSPVRNLLFYLCSAVLPVVAAVVLQFATAGNATPFTLMGLILTSCIVLVWVFSFVYKNWYELCAHRETWVRHSVCYGRLRLALNRFVVSRQTKEDYETLVSATFEILHRNYDQFLQNLSTNGVAKGGGKGAQEKGAT